MLRFIYEECQSANTVLKQKRKKYTEWVVSFQFKTILVQLGMTFKCWPHSLTWNWVRVTDLSDTTMKQLFSISLFLFGLCLSQTSAGNSSLFNLLKPERDGQEDEPNVYVLIMWAQAEINHLFPFCNFYSCQLQNAKVSSKCHHLQTFSCTICNFW